MFKDHSIIACLTLLLVAAPAARGAESGPPSKPPAADYMQAKWKLDPRCILPRGPGGSADSGVVGDPCIVWDDEIAAWRMFYFSSGPHGASTSIALSRSAEEIGPGDWRKTGLVDVDRSGMLGPNVWHKWWVVMPAGEPNRAARIDGKYWALFVTMQGAGKHIQAASAEGLAGPWKVRKTPILSPDPAGPDGLHCDAPTAYWIPDQKQVLILYMAYPRLAQKDQQGAPFGSSSMAAWWRPDMEQARKAGPILRPGQNDKDWNRGWVGGVQLLRDPTGAWYGLANGSPTPPADKSHREPALSLGGWVRARGPQLDKPWQVDNDSSPFRRPDDLTREELAAGLGANFWRHHLLATPGGNARIYFNSGPYGHEQLYSLVIDKPN
jgi:hypothetical protein